MDSLSITTAYQIGFRLKTCWPRNIRGKIRCSLSLLRHPSHGLRCFTPIDYVRYREFEFVLNAINHVAEGRRIILDIGSPKLLPLTLAYFFSESSVYATDIMQSEIAAVAKHARYLHLTNLVAETQDARDLDYSDNQFDLITSVSVFEHIAPEKDGDIPAAKELRRVLAPEGIAILTVPFSPQYFAEYRTGQVYERFTSPETAIFFQRFYDENLLMSNIVQASGLEIVYVGFIEERYFVKDPHVRLAYYINGSRRKTTIFGLWFPLLSRIFLSAPQPLDRCRKPYLACLILKKSS